MRLARAACGLAALMLFAACGGKPAAVDDRAASFANSCALLLGDPNQTIRRVSAGWMPAEPREHPQLLALHARAVAALPPGALQQSGSSLLIYARAAETGRLFMLLAINLPVGDKHVNRCDVYDFADTSREPDPGRVVEMWLGTEPTTLSYRDSVSEKVWETPQRFPFLAQVRVAAVASGEGSEAEGFSGMVWSATTNTVR